MHSVLFGNCLAKNREDGDTRFGEMLFFFRFFFSHFQYWATAGIVKSISNIESIVVI